MVNDVIGALLNLRSTKSRLYGISHNIVIQSTNQTVNQSGIVKVA